MDLTVNFHDEGDLTLMISNYSMTGFNDGELLPDEQQHEVEVNADDLGDTFLEYVE